jgi:preprotein translocase subunit SecE
MTLTAKEQAGVPGGRVMAKFNLFKFMQEVRSETDKVTWPTRRETLITTAMVFVMVTVAAIFFLLADQIIRLFITFVLGLGL